MYAKNETKAIAKKRYSFKKGFLQVTLSQKKRSEGEINVRSQNLSPDLFQ